MASNRNLFVNYYHSDELTTDTDGGNLVMLCNSCAVAYAHAVEGYAQDGCTEATCEKCDAGQCPADQAEQD